MPDASRPAREPRDIPRAIYWLVTTAAIFFAASHLVGCGGGDAPPMPPIIETDSSATVGGSATTGATAVASFFVGPSVKVAYGQHLQVEVTGTHWQRLFYDASRLDLSATLIAFDGTKDIELARIDASTPAYPAGQVSAVPVHLLVADADVPAGEYVLRCEYRVRAIDANGLPTSALSTFQAQGDWRIVLTQG
jgi:hypothetical protein